MKSRANTISRSELLTFRAKVNRLVNCVRLEEARQLCAQLRMKYPRNIEFPYLEAALEAEDDAGFTSREIAKRHASAAEKIRRLLPRIRSVEPEIRHKIRNEYYWFSHQPRKQYALGSESQVRRLPSGLYSQGVGAAQVAKAYALEGKHGLCLRWAKRSEKAWRDFFRLRPDWFNAYFFYAQVLGYQGRFAEMDQALKTAARKARKPAGWKACKEMRSEILATCSGLVDSSRTPRYPHK